MQRITPKENVVFETKMSKKAIIFRNNTMYAHHLQSTLVPLGHMQTSTRTLAHTHVHSHFISSSSDFSNFSIIDDEIFIWSIRRWQVISNVYKYRNIAAYMRAHVCAYVSLCLAPCMWVCLCCARCESMYFIKRAIYAILSNRFSWVHARTNEFLVLDVKFYFFRFLFLLAGTRLYLCWTPTHAHIMH